MRLALIFLSAFLVFSTMSASAGNPSTTETVNVTEGAANVGAATLIRKKQSATFRVNTSMLEPLSAYTIWIAAFNDWENCIGDCDGPDIAAADGSLFFGTAFLTGDGGIANVEFEVLAGDLPEGTYIADGHDNGINPGNGFSVELHLIIANHGLIDDIPDLDFADALSTPAPGEQFAIFK